MILIDGPRADIADAIIEGLQKTLAIWNIKKYGPDGKPHTLKQLVDLVQRDHRDEIHSGILAPGLDKATRSMLSYGLSAAGSVVVICGGEQAPENILPTVIVNDMSDVPKAVTRIITYRTEAMHWVDKLWEYRSLYSIGPQLTMIVGHKPMAAIDRHNQGMPFFGIQGQCIFLHDAFRLAGGKYYLTSAEKTGYKILDRETLDVEIKMIRPTRIIAMGSEASSSLARLRVNFIKAYHPQYWRRFKAMKMDELVAILKP